MPQGTMRIRRWLRLWLLGAASVLGFLVLAEAGLRLFHRALPGRWRADPALSTVAHPYIGHLNRPGRHSDPYGFRNEWPWPEAPGIITLGDSLTLGSDLEPAWPAILARALPEESIVNLGLGAAGPQQYARVFETFGAQLRARVILIGFFARNDFKDAAMFEGWLRSGAGGNYLIWRNAGRPAQAGLGFRQPLRQVVKAAVWRAGVIASTTHVGTVMRELTGQSRAWSQVGVEVYTVPDGTQIELQPDSFVEATRAARPGHRVFERVLAVLQRTHSLARENRGSAVVIFVPSKEEVYLPLLRRSLLEPAVPLRAALDELGIPTLDLLDAFRRRAASGEVLFNERDSQLPNARGQALIAELVLSHLRWHAERYGLPASSVTRGTGDGRHRQSGREGAGARPASAASGRDAEPILEGKRPHGPDGIRRRHEHR